MYTGSLFELSLEDMVKELKERRIEAKKTEREAKRKEKETKKKEKETKKNKVKTQKNKKVAFIFQTEKMKENYYLYRNYLKTRCELIPDQIERKYNYDCIVYYNQSNCRGMSNYIDISKGSDSITIRISDHEPTGSGSPCDYYIYIQDKTWMEIKKEVFRIAEDFLK